MAAGPAQQRAHAGQQLLGGERLGQIVVGAGVDALDLLAPAAARSQDQHREAPVGGPPGAQHGEPVELGQAQVQHDGVVGLGVAQKLGLLAVARPVDGIAGQFQHLLEVCGDAGLVLGQQQAHRLFHLLVALVLGLERQQGLGRRVDQWLGDHTVRAQALDLVDPATIACRSSSTSSISPTPRARSTRGSRPMVRSGPPRALRARVLAVGRTSVGCAEHARKDDQAQQQAHRPGFKGGDDQHFTGWSRVAERQLNGSSS